MNHDSYSDDYIADILSTARTFAFVGASANTEPPELLRHEVPPRQGLHASSPSIPASPDSRSSARRSTPSLADVPGPVDVIDIFRNSEAALDAAREAIALKDKLGLKVLWLQLGVRNDEAAKEAEAAGLKVVMNRCPKIEYGRLSGEIGWAGVNSGTISSLRPKLAAHGRAEPRPRRPSAEAHPRTSPWTALLPEPTLAQAGRSWMLERRGWRVGVIIARYLPLILLAAGVLHPSADRRPLFTSGALSARAESASDRSPRPPRCSRR